MVYPCKDCEDREVGCHSSCDKYKVAKKMDKRIKRQKRIGSEYAFYSFFRYKDRIARGDK